MSKKLFDLIHSMSKNEKGYFKKYASIHSNSNNIYTKLFIEIDKQNIYNSKYIEETLFSETKSNYFNVAKNYLYNIILKSLRNYHEQKKISYKVDILLMNVEILYGKKLIEQCDIELNKAIKLIEKYEIFEKSLKYYNWKRKLLLLKGFNTKNDLLEIQYEKERDEYRFKKQNLEKYVHYQYQFYSSRTQYGIKSVKLKNIISNEYFEDESNALSNRSKMLFYNTKCSYYHIIDNQKFYIYAKKFVDLLENNEYMIIENFDSKIGATYNLLIATTYLKDKNIFYENLNKFNEIPKKYSKYCSKEQKKLISFYSFNIHLFFLIYIEDFEAAYSLKSKESISEIKGIFFDIYIECLYNAAYTCFSLGKNAEAQDLLNEFNNYSTKTKTEKQANAYLLNLLNHYDLNNLKLVNNIIETNSKKLKKENDVFGKNIIKMLSKLLKIDSPEQKIKIFKNSKKLFVKLKKDESYKGKFVYLNIIRWINLKLKKN